MPYRTPSRPSHCRPTGCGCVALDERGIHVTRDHELVPWSEIRCVARHVRVRGREVGPLVITWDDRLIRLPTTDPDSLVAEIEAYLSARRESA